MAKKFVLSDLSDQHELVIAIKETLSKATKQTVAFVSVEKMKKTAGIATKAIIYNFENGQSITLVLRVDGDVIQIKLNGKVIPLSKVMDYDKMADFNAGLEDIALKLKGNQAKFDKKRAMTRVVIPTTKAPSRTVKKRIEQARSALIEMKASIEQKEKMIAKTNEDLAKMLQEQDGGAA